jgi:hypothetical protein
MANRRRPDLPVVHEQTHLLRIPLTDWAAVTQGRKTEIRFGRPMLHPPHTPSAAIGYAWSRFRAENFTAMLVIEDAWSEVLGSISPESLEREGFDSFVAFRTYWRERVHGHTFLRDQVVTVLRLRPWRDGDRELVATAMFDRMYGVMFP